MANTILRDSVIIAILALGTTYFVSHRSQIYDWAGLDISQEQSPNLETQSTSLEPTKTATHRRGLMVSIPKSKRDGHFWTRARVNNGMVKFLVDTGAGTVALTPEDARRAGIKISDLDYNLPISTAGGQNMAARVTLKHISIGPVALRNIEAIVVPEGLNTSLLGMSFLGELQKVEATPHTLILKL